MGLIWALIIGAIAGWLAGKLVEGGGFGLVGNIAVGIVGGVIGSFLLGWLGIAPGGGAVGSIIGATIGAVVLLMLIRLVRR
jgi:uncharacterized membrane protein YeaQ/YmgE (transglycosylase-associated protein family)